MPKMLKGTWVRYNVEDRTGCSIDGRTEFYSVKEAIKRAKSLVAKEKYSQSYGGQPDRFIVVESKWIWQGSH